MREIKFRAWQRTTKQMLFNVATGVIYLDGQFRSSDCDFMQYTGLHDKNGKEIYEGDVIDWWNCEFLGRVGHEHHDPECYVDGGVVEYDPDKACYCVRQGETLYTIPYNRPLTVIGNIYENLELVSQ